MPPAIDASPAVVTKRVIHWTFLFLGDVRYTITVEPERGDTVETSDDAYTFKIYDKDSVKPLTTFIPTRNMLFVSFEEQQQVVLDDKNNPVAQHLAHLARKPRPAAAPPVPA